MERGDRNRLEKLRKKFYEGTSTLTEEKELAELSAERIGTELAEEAMFALFEKEKQVHYPCAAIPLRRRKRKDLLLFAASAAVMALMVTLSVTVWAPQQPAVFCIVDGIAVTDPVVATEKKEMAVEALLAALEGTSSMIDTFEELGRAVGELENLGFGITFR